MLADFFGVRSMRGLRVLAPLLADGLFPDGQQIVDAACASGSAAFHGAWSAIHAGADLTLAIGVEKMNTPDGDGVELLDWMAGGLPDSYWDPYRALAAELGVTFEPGAGRSIAMDTTTAGSMWWTRQSCGTRNHPWRSDEHHVRRPAMTERARAAVLVLGLLALVAGIVITTVIMISATSSWATQPTVPEPSTTVWSR